MTPVRFTRLKQLAKSPAHYAHACSSVDEEPSAAMVRGRGVHAVILDTPHVVWDGGVRRGKEWDAFKAEHSDRPIMNPTEYAAARAMRASVLRHDLAREVLFRDGMVREQRIEWTRDGIACHGTPDAYGCGIVADLKTTKSADPERFVRDAKWYGYHAQLAWYADALARLGVDVTELYIVAVEATAPYPVTLVQLDASAWAAGDAQCAVWWGKFWECIKSGSWPGYTDAAVRFGVERNETLSIGGEDFEF